MPWPGKKIIPGPALPESTVDCAPDERELRDAVGRNAFGTAYGLLLRPVHAVGWPTVRLGAYAVYAGVLLWIVITDGAPTGRLALAVIIVSGLALTRLGRGWPALARVVIDWLPFTLVLMAYDRTRAVADSLGVPLHEADVLGAEKWLFGGVEPTVWMQGHLYSPAHVYWYDALCTLVYTTHFLATPILAAVLWLRARAIWLGYIVRVIVLSLAGLLTYCLFPEAPPWLAARDGLSAPVSRLSARGWEWFHLGDVNATLARAQVDGVNAVAAMPSLHTAFATLVAITVFRHVRSRWRWLLVLYPAAMGFTLVYTGEHYVLDLLAGVAYALAVNWAVGRWEAYRVRRKAALAAAASLTERDAVGVAPAADH